MKAKYLWVVLITLVFFGCDDNTGGLGIGMLPGSDGITVQSTKFDVQTESSRFEDGKVFAKTNIGYVGRFTDTEYGFGYYEGSFLTELNCIDDLKFPEPYDVFTNRNGKGNNFAIPSGKKEDLEDAYVGTDLVIGYYEFFGDSLKPIQIGAYEIKKKLQKDHYTDVDPNDYLTSTEDPNITLLGKKTFSAVNLADSLRHTENYLPTAVINSKKIDELGKELIKKNWDNPNDFKDSDAFIENIFKGIYVKNEAGDGTVIYVQHAYLQVKFKSYELDSLGNKLKMHDEVTDSTKIYSRMFASTMEVIQANQIKVSEAEIEEKAEQKNHTYLKSPAGIYTKAVLPIADIKKGLDLDNDTINAVKLSLNGYHHETVNQFSMKAPTSVLLIKDSEVKDFFEKNMLPNNTTSYVAYYSNNQYTFTNITRLVTSYIKEMETAKAEIEKNGGVWDEKLWLQENPVAIIPVVLGLDANKAVTNVQHDLKPTFVKLKGGDPAEGGSLLDLEVTYSTFSK